MQTTEYKTTTAFKAKFCYATNVVAGSLRRTRRCTASREKRAIEINGIKGFIGEISYSKQGLAILVILYTYLSITHTQIITNPVVKTPS